MPGIRLEKRFIAAAAVILAAGLTIPRAALNYGWDGDSFRSAAAAELLWQTGRYLPSRLPGSPLFEYLLAPLSFWGGHLTSNLIVLLFYVLAVFVFRKLAEDRSFPAALTLIFAFCPVLLLNAATCMDYIPALAFLLLAVQLVRERRLSLSALALGVSIGFRSTGALTALAVASWLLLKRRHKNAFAYLVLCGAIGGAFYLPVFIRYGFSMFVVPWSAPDLSGYALMAGYRGLMFLGPAAWTAIALIVAANWMKRGEAVRSSKGSRSLLFFFESATPVLYGLIFILHPDEVAYLLPIIPFILLRLGRRLNYRQLAVLGILIFSHGFITLDLLGGRSGRRRIEPRIAAGILIRDWLDRRELNLLRDSMDRLDLPDKSVVITGMSEMLTYRNDAVEGPDSLVGALLLEDGSWDLQGLDRLKDRDIHLVYSLSRQNVERLQDNDRPVYMFSAFAPSIAINNFGYDPWSLGIVRVEIFSRRAFYRREN